MEREFSNALTSMDENPSHNLNKSIDETIDESINEIINLTNQNNKKNQNNENNENLWKNTINNFPNSKDDPPLCSVKPLSIRHSNRSSPNAHNKSSSSTSLASSNSQSSISLNSKPSKSSSTSRTSRVDILQALSSGRKSSGALVPLNSLLSELRQSEQLYLAELHIMEKTTLTNQLCSLHQEFESKSYTVSAIIEWAQKAIPIYEQYILEYTYEPEQSSRAIYLSKRPLVRLTFLSKLFKKMVEILPENPLLNLIALSYRRLLISARKHYDREKKRALYERVLFDRVISTDTFLPVSAQFDVNLTLYRAKFDLSVFNRDKTIYPVRPAELFLLKPRDSSSQSKRIDSLAICSYEPLKSKEKSSFICVPSLMFPIFKSRELFISFNAETEIVLANHSGFTINISSMSLDLISRWRILLLNLFRPRSFSSNYTSPSSSQETLLNNESRSSNSNSATTNSFTSSSNSKSAEDNSENTSFYNSLFDALQLSSPDSPTVNRSEKLVKNAGLSSFGITADPPSPNFSHSEEKVFLNNAPELTQIQTNPFRLKLDKKPKFLQDSLERNNTSFPTLPIRPAPPPPPSYAAPPPPPPPPPSYAAPLPPPSYAAQIPSYSEPLYSTPTTGDKQLHEVDFLSTNNSKNDEILEKNNINQTLAPPKENFLRLSFDFSSKHLALSDLPEFKTLLLDDISEHVNSTAEKRLDFNPMEESENRAIPKKENLRSSRSGNRSNFEDIQEETGLLTMEGCLLLEEKLNKVIDDAVDADNSSKSSKVQNYDSLPFLTNNQIKTLEIESTNSSNNEPIINENTGQSIDLNNSPIPEPEILVQSPEESKINSTKEDTDESNDFNKNKDILSNLNNSYEVTGQIVTIPEDSISFEIVTPSPRTSRSRRVSTSTQSNLSQVKSRNSTIADKTTSASNSKSSLTHYRHSSVEIDDAEDAHENVVKSIMNDSLVSSSTADSSSSLVPMVSVSLPSNGSHENNSKKETSKTETHTIPIYSNSKFKNLIYSNSLRTSKNEAKEKKRPPRLSIFSFKHDSGSKRNSKSLINSMTPPPASAPPVPEVSRSDSISTSATDSSLESVSTFQSKRSISTTTTTPLSSPANEKRVPSINSYNSTIDKSSGLHSKNFNGNSLHRPYSRETSLKFVLYRANTAVSVWKDNKWEKILDKKTNHHESRIEVGPGLLEIWPIPNTPVGEFTIQQLVEGPDYSIQLLPTNLIRMGSAVEVQIRQSNAENDTVSIYMFRFKARQDSETFARIAKICARKQPQSKNQVKSTNKAATNKTIQPKTPTYLIPPLLSPFSPACSPITPSSPSSLISGSPSSPLSLKFPKLLSKLTTPTGTPIQGNISSLNETNTINNEEFRSINVNNDFETSVPLGGAPLKCTIFTKREDTSGKIVPAARKWNEIGQGSLLIYPSASKFLGYYIELRNSLEEVLIAEEFPISLFEYSESGGIILDSNLNSNKVSQHTTVACPIYMIKVNSEKENRLDPIVESES